MYTTQEEFSKMRKVLSEVRGSSSARTWPFPYSITVSYHLMRTPFNEFSLTQVSATFAASLVTSPAIGAYVESMYSDSVVIALATAVAVLDVLFILCFVPESLPEKLRPTQWSSNFSWEKADPFGVSCDHG